MNELFKKFNLKSTKQRVTVLQLVKDLGDDATAINIASSCSDTVDNSTVYRIIDLFLEKGIFDRMINYNNEIYYCIKEEHGHYFTCVKCHRKEKIECPIDDIEKDFENEKGYKILSHTVHIDGICNDCQKK